MPPPPRSTLFPYTTLFRSVVRLAGDDIGFSAEQQFNGAGHVRGVDLLAPLGESDRLAAQDLADDVIPFAGAGRMGQSVNTGRDRKSTRLNSSHPSISYAVF